MANSSDIRTRILDEKSHGIGLDRIAKRIEITLDSEDDHSIKELINLLDQEGSDEAYIAAKVLVALKTPKAVPSLVLALQRTLKREEGEKNQPIITTDFDAALAELLSASSLNIRSALRNLDSGTLTNGLIQLAQDDMRQAKEALRILESCPEWQEFLVDFRPQIVEIEKGLEEKSWKEKEKKKIRQKEVKELRGELREKRKKISNVEKQVKRITKHLRSMQDEAELSKLQKSVEDVARFTKKVVDFPKYKKDPDLEELLSDDIKRTEREFMKVDKLLSEFETKLNKRRAELSKKKG
ncbi:MAG: hypothetical protein ACFFCQ_02925 [Promethearchaeota archaeon]